MTVVDPAPMARPNNTRGRAPSRVPDAPAKERIEVRVTGEEKAAIQAGAADAKKNTSDYLRDLAIEDAARRTGATVAKQAPRSARNRATKLPK